MTGGGSVQRAVAFHIMVEMLNHSISYSVSSGLILGMGLGLSCVREGTGGFFSPSIFSLLQVGHKAGKRRF